MNQILRTMQPYFIILPCVDYILLLIGFVTLQHLWWRWSKTEVCHRYRSHPDQLVWERWRFTITELSEDFPKLSWSSICMIVTERLRYQNICARWAPKMLMDDHGTNGIGLKIYFILWGWGGRFFEIICDKRWNFDSLWQPRNQTIVTTLDVHEFLNKPNKFKQTFSNKIIVLLATVFWDQKGVSLVDLMVLGTTVNANTYCYSLWRLSRTIKTAYNQVSPWVISIFYKWWRSGWEDSTSIQMRSFETMDTWVNI